MIRIQIVGLKSLACLAYNDMIYTVISAVTNGCLKAQDIFSPSHLVKKEKKNVSNYSLLYTMYIYIL